MELHCDVSVWWRGRKMLLLIAAPGCHPSLSHSLHRFPNVFVCLFLSAAIMLLSQQATPYRTTDGTTVSKKVFRGTPHAPKDKLYSLLWPFLYRTVVLWSQSSLLFRLTPRYLLHWITPSQYPSPWCSLVLGSVVTHKGPPPVHSVSSH